MKGGGVEPGAWPLEELWMAYAKDPEGHLLIPHVGGRRCILDWHYPKLERLIEIGSSRGHFGWLYQEAMERGYKIGASMAGDEHRGRCGGLVATVWFALSGPPGLPPDIVSRLNAESQRMLAVPEVRARLRADGIVPQPLGAQAFTDFVASELKRWTPIIRNSGARAG